MHYTNGSGVFRIPVHLDAGGEQGLCRRESYLSSRSTAKLELGPMQDEHVVPTATFRKPPTLPLDGLLANKLSNMRTSPKQRRPRLARSRGGTCAVTGRFPPTYSSSYGFSGFSTAQVCQ